MSNIQTQAATPAGDETTDADTTSKEQYRRMFGAACEALGAINEALGLDPNDGGAEPILHVIGQYRQALKFYADKRHFHMHDPHAWDTVSGEPPNFWEDEFGTATVEDGSIAKLVLEGKDLDWDEDAIADANLLACQPQATPAEPATHLSFNYVTQTVQADSKGNTFEFTKLPTYVESGHRDWSDGCGESPAGEDNER